MTRWGAYGEIRGLIIPPCTVILPSAKNTSYVYNLDGSVATLNYPSGRAITYTIGAAGLPTGVTDYASAALYTPWGALSSIQMADNSIFVSNTYNTRLQPSTTTVYTLEIDEIMSKQYNYNLGAGDNGNLVGVTNILNTNRSQIYSYDALNRLTNAQTVGGCSVGCWDLAFSLDEWANLTSVAGTQLATLTPNANNQIGVAPFTYDASGNELTDATLSYTWNAESQIKTAGGVTYLYDGHGNRAEKSGSRMYWYGPSGEVLDETDAAGSTSNANFSEYIYFGGQRIAWRDYQDNMYTYVQDQVGSSRMIVDPTGRR